MMGLFSLIKSDSNVTELLLFPICIQGVWFEQECWLLDNLIEFTEKFLTGVEVHPTSVSYTHLDVYKRQIFNTFYIVNFTSTSVKIPYTKPTTGVRE